MFSQDNTCPDLLIVTNCIRYFGYGALTLYDRTFQTALL